MEIPDRAASWPPAAEAASPPDVVETRPLRDEAPDVDEPTGAIVVEQAVRIGVGLLSIGLASLAEALRRTLPSPVPTDELAPERTDLLGLVTGATLGLTLTIGDRVATTVGGLARAVGPPIAWVAGVPPLGPAAAWFRDVAAELDGRWRASRPGTEAVAAAFTREVVPEVIDAVLDQLDLTWLVAERVDLDELVARVDLDAAVERVDMERILGRIDLDEVAARIDIDAIIHRVDLDEIVRGVDLDAIVSRVDIDAVASRIDLDAIVDRIDIVGLARYVVEEIDLPEIIRESTGSMASETVRGVRMQGIGADEAVSRVVDRMLLRRQPRRTEAPAETEAPVIRAPDDPEPPGPAA